jgi:D-sedoheptulose 7-phosphate isomerase
MQNIKFSNFVNSYLDKIKFCFNDEFIDSIFELKVELKNAWINKKNIFICGNGGSGANANHIANDLLYGVGFNRETGVHKLGMRVESLVSNPGVITCLANDINYENIFAKQIEIKGDIDDLLIVLSGSGNSKNIIKALEVANLKKLKTFAIVGFDGGESKKIAKKNIHSPIKDMEISEDIQMIIFNICKQWLINNPPS